MAPFRAACRPALDQPFRAHLSAGAGGLPATGAIETTETGDSTSPRTNPKRELSCNISGTSTRAV